MQLGARKVVAATHAAASKGRATRRKGAVGACAEHTQTRACSIALRRPRRRVSRVTEAAALAGGVPSNEPFTLAETTPALTVPSQIPLKPRSFAVSSICAGPEAVMVRWPMQPGVRRRGEPERPAIVEGLGAERLDARGVARRRSPPSFAASPGQSAACASASAIVCAPGWPTFAPVERRGADVAASAARARSPRGSACHRRSAVHENGLAAGTPAESASMLPIVSTLTAATPGAPAFAARCALITGACSGKPASIQFVQRSRRLGLEALEMLPRPRSFQPSVVRAASNNAA